jgi:hypothetical protein
VSRVIMTSSYTVQLAWQTADMCSMLPNGTNKSHLLLEACHVFLSTTICVCLPAHTGSGRYLYTALLGSSQGLRLTREQRSSA